MRLRPATGEYRKGDRVVYTGGAVFDLLIVRGDVGVVERVEDGWVAAWWPRSGLHSVPSSSVRPVDDA